MPLMRRTKIQGHLCSHARDSKKLYHSSTKSTACSSQVNHWSQMSLSPREGILIDSFWPVCYQLVVQHYVLNSDQIT